MRYSSNWQIDLLQALQQYLVYLITAGTAVRGEMERERQCWEQTSLEHLQEIGVHTGLTAYIDEIEQRLTRIILSD